MNPNFMGAATPQGIPPQPGFESIRAAFNAEVNQKLGLRQLEWLFAIPARVTIPAGGGIDTTINIKSDAHFECHFLTGGFSTLIDGAEAADDDGVNRVSFRITDGSNDLKLFNDFIPANLVLSPGRQLSAVLVGNTPSPASSLFYPFPFYHIFPANGGIVLEAQNASDYDNTLDLLFWGKKLRAEIGDASQS